MLPARKKNVRLAALLAMLVASAALLPITWRDRLSPASHGTTVATAPTPATGPIEMPPPPAPPGAEVVPPEESEDQGPPPKAPRATISVARSEGLNRAPDPLHLNSSVALLVDADSGEVLAHKNDQAVLPMASLTKLMTSLVVLEARQPMDEVLTITQDDVDTLRHSRSRLKVGTRLTRQEALHLALMSSENRAAHALARNYPGGLDKAIAAMNAKAKQLGMKDTVYEDPTGLTDHNRTTARDLAVLVRAAAQDPVIREFSTTPAHLANLGGRTLQYVNSNRLVRNQRAGWDIELQKTGYIVEAGRCMTMLTKVAGHDLVLVLMDADSDGARVNDAERMRHWAFAQWGVPDIFAQARPRAAHRVLAATRERTRAARHVAAPHKAASREAKAKPKAGTVVARKEAQHKSAARPAAVASNDKPAGHKETKRGRVHESFAATHPEPKS